MFHIQTELINRSFPKKGIQMYSEIIENGGLLFFVSYEDLEKFFALYLDFNKKGYDHLIHTKECSPVNMQGMLQSSIQITAEFTSPEISKEKIIDYIYSIYDQIVQHITNLCQWGEKCTCMKIERLNPTNLLIYLRREEDLSKILLKTPLQKKREIEL